MEPEQAFYEETQRFCSFVREAASVGRASLFAEARVRVAAIYAAGSVLVRAAAPDAESELELERLDAGAVPRLGFDERDGYSQMFNPYDDASLVGSSLEDDFGDIYLDVEYGLRYWEAGHRGDAVFHWRLMFDHWGRHAVGAIAALHEAHSHGPG